MSISLGIDILLTSGYLGGLRVGVVCNPSSVNRELSHTVDRIWNEPNVTLVGIFGPQHGFHSDSQDNMVETSHSIHSRYGVPIFSLYSDIREPTEEMFEGIDVLVIDLQDVGTRVYTYIYTMANCLRAAKKYGVKVIVCDRPNPITGYEVEGPILQSGYESFVGQFPIPLRHGMTIGELAKLFNEHFGIRSQLTINCLEGWTRTKYFDEIEMPWVMPSPNLPTLDSALAYPGAVLVEGTNLSEGRGTTRPFELIGAPWVMGDEISEQLNQMTLPGVCFRPVQFNPTHQKYAGQLCGGCQIHIIDRLKFTPVATMVTLLQAFYRSYPDKFEWRNPPYEYEELKLPIDILFGSDRLRHQFNSNIQATEISAGWEDELKGFSKVRERYLLY